MSGKTERASEQNPEKRHRIAFDVDASAHEEIRVAAAYEGVKVAEFSRMIVLRHLDAKHEEELRESLGPPPPGVEETLEAKQGRFVDALEETFGVNKACRLTQLPLDVVKEWLKDEAFAGRARDAQESYIEAVELDLVAIGRGRIKGNVLALTVFLNGHSRVHGRPKLESYARDIGKIIEEFFEIAQTEAGQQMGERLVAKFRERGEAFLSKLCE